MFLKAIEMFLKVRTEVTHETTLAIEGTPNLLWEMLNFVGGECSIL